LIVIPPRENERACSSCAMLALTRGGAQTLPRLSRSPRA
jgi:hypothetical protein